MKKQSGVTLITLIVTIIVLLIIAGIAISMLSGENAILNQAINAKKQTELSNQNENNNLNEMFISIRTLQGTGRQKYNVTDEHIPQFIKESEIESGINTKNDNYSITFKNYDKTISEEIYNPTQYKKLEKNKSITIEIADDYLLYVYACANSNEDNKGKMEVKNINTDDIEIEYNLLNRKTEGAEPLAVKIHAGKYKITTSYLTWIFKIQLEPINNFNNNNSNNSNNTEDKSVITWEAPTSTEYTLPDWLLINENKGLRQGDTPFMDTTIVNCIKFKNGFSIDLQDKIYKVEIYITGGSSEKTLTLDEDSSFSQTLNKRSILDQSSIILNNKTGKLNFKVTGESQLYKIILTEVK